MGWSKVIYTSDGGCDVEAKTVEDSCGGYVKWTDVEPFTAERDTLFSAAAAKFWAGVDRTDRRGCWPWQRSVDKYGYGLSKLAPGIRRAHRAAWFFAHGSLDKSSQVLHGCDNPACCNPEHLRLGDPKANSDDKVARGRHYIPPLKLVCPRGHQKRIRNGNRTWCPECTRDINRRRRSA